MGYSDFKQGYEVLMREKTKEPFYPKKFHLCRKGIIKHLISLKPELAS